MKTFKKYLFILFVFLIIPFSFASAKDFADNLRGRLLLQVESSGSVWYVNPTDSKRYEITRDNALDVFRKFALGISNKDLEKIPTEVNNNKKTREDLKGKFLLQVENGGNIWYVDFFGIRHEVTKLNLIDILKKHSLGIKNSDLNKIEKSEIIQKEDVNNNNDNVKTPIKAELSEDQYLKKFLDSWNLIKEKYVGELDYNLLVESAISGMLSNLNDSYSSYMSKDSASEFSDSLDGQFEGVGMQINIQDGVLTVVMPISDSPALLAGIKAGDKVVAIDGISTNGMSLDKASELIKGKSGSMVVLDVIHQNGNPERFKVTRGLIEYSGLSYSIKNNEVGYIKMEKFSGNTDFYFKKAIDNLLNKKVSSLIIDLRDNPGGYLDSVVAISDYWLDDMIILKEVFRDGNTRNINSQEGAILKNMKTVVLINSRSASASEILAGALQDYELATIIGQKSYGKGSVQELLKLEDGSSIKVTTAKWFTPNGKSIDQNGIDPDIEIIPSQDSGTDSQLERALKFIKTGK
ncbi:MAG: S41 family peptidase [Patescibacteria group bacterium]|nr:S41 family peptidase [Patescibacteria group bacterium]MDD4304034.1 S41 family peptidase [Patescibacteria group bacterium]MDD4694911.1 S41 family peptidase [Patescibacteria group bacterium]